MSNPFNIFNDILGGSKATVPTVDPGIAFDVWFEKQPLASKLPNEAAATVKIRVEDMKRMFRAAYVAGFERSNRA